MDNKIHIRQNNNLQGESPADTLETMIAHWEDIQRATNAQMAELIECSLITLRDELRRLKNKELRSDK